MLFNIFQIPSFPFHFFFLLGWSVYCGPPRNAFLSFSLSLSLWMWTAFCSGVWMSKSQFKIFPSYSFPLSESRLSKMWQTDVSPSQILITFVLCYLCVVCVLRVYVSLAQKVFISSFCLAVFAFFFPLGLLRLMTDARVQVFFCLSFILASCLIKVWSTTKLKVTVMANPCDPISARGAGEHLRLSSFSGSMKTSMTTRRQPVNAVAASLPALLRLYVTSVCAKVRNIYACCVFKYIL